MVGNLPLWVKGLRKVSFHGWLKDVETNLTDEVSLTPETRRLLRRIAARGKAFRIDRAKAIHQAKAEGGSLREIAKELGITHPAVRDIAIKPVPNGSEEVQE